MDGDGIAQFEVLRFTDSDFDGDEVEAVFGEEGGAELCASDVDEDGDHAPALGDEAGDLLNEAALLRWDGDIEPGGRPSPEDDLTGKVEVHVLKTSPSGE